MVYNINSLFKNPSMSKVDCVCWKSHFLGVLRLHGLNHILEDPDQKLHLDNGDENLEFKKWSKSKHLVLTWIRSTVSPSVQAMIVHCVTAKQALALLDHFLSLLCSIHIKLLRLKLYASKKKSETPMSETVGGGLKREPRVLLCETLGSLFRPPLLSINCL